MVNRCAYLVHIMSESAQNRLQYLFAKLENVEQSESASYKALNELRNDFIPHQKRLDAFIQAGGLKHIVTKLQDPNKKIVDVSLSILSHCALNSEACVLVRNRFIL